MGVLDDDGDQFAAVAGSAMAWPPRRIPTVADRTRRGNGQAGEHAGRGTLPSEYWAREGSKQPVVFTESPQHSWRSLKATSARRPE